jgi:hypothetical protein
MVVQAPFVIGYLSQRLERVVVVLGIAVFDEEARRVRGISLVFFISSLCKTIAGVIEAICALRSPRASSPRFCSFHSFPRGVPPGLTHRAADIACGHVWPGAGMGCRRVFLHRTEVPAGAFVLTRSALVICVGSHAGLERLSRCGGEGTAAGGISRICPICDGFTGKQDGQALINTEFSLDCGPIP